MNIKIIAVGKIKEAYNRELIKEYEKRLSPFCGFSVIEVQAEPILDESNNEKYKLAEAERILQYIKPNSYIITLEIEGKMLSSEEFARKINEIMTCGVSEVVFIIGGANGLHQNVSKIAHFKLSFSKMTFTHQMIRGILAEQIYRAFKINKNEKYHR